MKLELIPKRITDVLDETARLNNELCAMNTIGIQRYPDNYEVLSTDAAIRGEKIACKLRHLLYSTTNIKKDGYLRAAAEALGIEIVFENGILEITVPRLLPKRKQKQGSEFITDPFYAALNKYAENNAIEKFRECMVCFSHIYAKDLPISRIRDYDNLELKQILDMAAAFFMTDDSGYLCDTYHTTEFGENDNTKIWIMNKNDFPEWLKNH
jgi:hypothetical protein